MPKSEVASRLPHQAGRSFTHGAVRGSLDRLDPRAMTKPGQHREPVEEDLANLKEALELYFEDEALPEELEPPIIATLRLSA
jgi:hypothetical protein